MSRAQVRHVVIGTARQHRVWPRLALAIAWQESGWQQGRVSSAGALGVMQVMPATGRDLSRRVGRRLDLRSTSDNVVAGVVLLRLLREQASLRRSVAAYYQGLTSVRRRGMYADTKSYVANVLAIRRHLIRGWLPY